MLALALPSSVSALIININPGTGLAGNAAALGAFNRAAQQWESLFSDTITVNIDADLLNLGSGTVIGSTSTVLLQGNYDLIRNAMVTDGLADGDGIVAFLPTAAQFSAFVPTGFGLDGNIAATKANLKALGFTGLDGSFGANDATINFNTGFAFDFDNSDGVGAGLIDFETVAGHEIGHALGFVSVVDTIDSLLNSGTTADVSPDPMDLFRFQNDVGGQDPATTADFTNNPRFLPPGGDAIFDSLDTELGLSTGAFNGDGRQASHFKDNNLTGVLLGVMDPTLAFGQIIPISNNDTQVFDLIGYDYVATVSEPSSLALLSVGFIFLTGFAWRRKARAR